MAENVLRIKIESDEPTKGGGGGGTSSGAVNEKYDYDAFFRQHANSPTTVHRPNPELDAIFGINTPPPAAPKAPESDTYRIAYPKAIAFAKPVEPDTYKLAAGEESKAPGRIKPAIKLDDEESEKSIGGGLSDYLASGNFKDIARIARAFGYGDISAAINSVGKSGVLGNGSGGGAGGGAGGGGSGTAASLIEGAGPIVLGVAAAKLSEKINTMIHERIRSGIEGSSKLAGSIISNDPMKAFNIAAEGAASKLEDVGLAGKFVAEQIRTGMVAIGALNDVIAVTAERGRELQAYSGAITRAVADQEISKLRNDIRESQQLGGDYGRVISAQTRTEDAMREAILPIKESMVSLTADLSEKIADIAEIVKPGIQITGDIVGLLVEYKDVLFPIFSSIELSLKTAKWLSSLLAGIREIFAKDDEVAQDALDQILKMADLNMPFNAKQEAANPPDDSLNIPIFN